MTKHVPVIPSKTSAFVLINRIVACLNQDFDLDTGLELALQELIHHFDIDTTVVLIQTNTGLLVPQVSTGVRIDALTRLSDHLKYTTTSVSYDVLDQLEPYLVDQVPASSNSEETDPYLTFLQESGLQSALFIPMLDAYSACGVLVLHSSHLNHFTEQDVELLLTIGRQFALSVDRFELLQAEREASYQAEVLREIGDILGQSLDFDHVLDEVLQRLERVVPFNSATVALVQNGRTQAIRAHGYEQYGEDVVQRAWGLSLIVAETPILKKIEKLRAPLIIDDAQRDAEWIPYPEFSYIRSWVGTPVFLYDEVVAFLFLEKREPYFYRATHVLTLDAFSSQLSLSLQNARLFAEKSQHAHTLSVLNKLLNTISAYHTVSDVCMITAELVLQIFAHLNAVVLLCQSQPEILQVAGFSGAQPDFWELGKRYQNADADRALQSSKTVVINDYELKGDEPEMTDRAVRSACFVPIRTNFALIGVLVIECIYPNTFSDAEQAVYRTVADQLALALEKARLIEETQQDAAEIEALYLTSAAVRDAQTLAQIGHDIVKQCTQVTLAAGSSLMLMRPNGDLTVIAVYPSRPESIGVIYPAGQGIVGHVAKTRQIYIAEDIPNDPFTYRPPDDTRRFTGAKTSISVPLKNQDRLVGVLNLWYMETHVFEQREIRFISTIADIATNAIERGVLLETLELRIFDRTVELETANERLHELDRLKSKFITDMTHELLTPIASLSLQIDLLKRVKPERQAKHIQTLRDQVNGLKGLVNNVINISRLDADEEGASKMVAIDFNELVRTLVEHYEGTLDTSKLTIELDLDKALRPLRGSPADLTQMLKHVLKNGIDYTLGGKISISTKINVGGRDFSCCVKDTGIGIADRDLPHIFERFYRSEDTTNIKGVGLGLSIVKAIVEQHNGTVSIESELHVGTEICITLPFSS